MCLHSLSALSPETWPFSLELLPQPAYMVGGAVRDALLGRRREYLDLDFVVPDGAVKAAQRIANFYKAGFVLLDAERQIARVVFEQATADFAEQEGPNLETDLHRRDFRVNAIAYNPHTGEIIDPLQGYADLQQNLIRMVCAKNLQDDPLRLLRAYRQAAQLNFVIEPETQSAIRQLASCLSQVAAERVNTELSYLLSSSQGTPWLAAAWEDGLLQLWFPSRDAVGDVFTRLATVDRSGAALRETWPEFGNMLSALFGDTTKTSWLAIAKLATLLSPTPEEAETELLRLKYSRAEIRAVTTALRFLPQLRSEASATAPSSHMSLRDQYIFFQGVGQVFPVAVVLAVADGKPVEELSYLIDRYLNPHDQVAHPTPLITGNDLMKVLNLRSGPQVGRILNSLGLARAEGKISTAAEALEFAAQLLDTR